MTDGEHNHCLSYPDEYNINNEIKFPPKNQCRVLIVGCGNSSLGHDMLRDEWCGGITNVDYSSVVISQMMEKYFSDTKLPDKMENNKSEIKQCKSNVMLKGNKDSFGMKFVCADITQGLECPDSSFDLIIDKGLLDSLLCSSVADCRLAMDECSRLLNEEHGAMVIFSRKKPDDRLQFIESPGWTGGIWHYHIPPTKREDESWNTFKE